MVPVHDGRLTLAMIQSLIPIGLRAVEDARRQLQERHHDDAEWLVLVPDGKILTR